LSVKQYRQLGRKQFGDYHYHVRAQPNLLTNSYNLIHCKD